MARIGEAELKKQLSENIISNAYIIYGEENYLKELYVKKLQQAVVEPAFADFNMRSFEGRTVTLTEILQDADMIPMMAEYTFILVHDYPFDRSSKEIEELKGYLKDLSDTCVIVFWYDSIVVDEKKSDSKWKSIVNAFAKYGEAVNLQKRTEGELAKLIVSSAKKRKCTIDLANARYLISIVGSDIKTIFNELEKLCAYASGGEITKEIIDELAVKCLQARVYDLSKFIIAGNSDAAYGVLNSLIAMKEEPISINAIISANYIDMYRVKCAKASGVAESDVANYFNYKGRDFVIKNASRDCRNLSFESLRTAIDVLAEADAKMKSSSIDKAFVLEETIAKLLLLRNR